MKPNFPQKRITALTLLAMMSLVASAAAADQVATDQDKKDSDAKQDVLQLNSIVVTGTSVRASKMSQSLSVSSITSDELAMTAPTNAAEALRDVPGIRAESSGGEGNANVTVRGAPISAGGSRYVQFQEDGLPILLFGDISFGTADEFLRVDGNVESVEVIRGGSASTMASNSPGGVINFISKSGRTDGGSVGLTAGLGGSQKRMDFDYGHSMGDTYVHAGGFYRSGDGGRDIGYDAAKGGQVKLSVGHDFANGDIRLTVKSLDDRTPTFLPTPAHIVGGEVQSLPGIDPRNAYFIRNGMADPNMDHNGNAINTTASDGLRVKSTAVGVEGNLKFGEGWSLEERFRTASNSGRFIGLFPANNGDGPTPASSTTFTGTLFNTSIDDLGNTFNDVRVRKEASLGGDSKIVGTGGLFLAKQKVALTWNWNQYTVGMATNGANAVFLNPPSVTWGNCCVRTFDVSYTQTSPYAALNWISGPLNIDASVRHEGQKASGYSLTDNASGQFDPATRKTVNYSTSKTPWSIGANYSFDKNLSVFIRDSSGVAYAADRLLYGKALDGSLPIDYNKLDQLESGVKYRNGGFSSFVTGFHAKTVESNYEATTQQFTANSYTANGVEVEAAYRAGIFGARGGITYTNAKIDSAIDPTTVGKKPRRQADLVYQVSPNLHFENGLEIGAALIGTGKSYADDANTFILPAFQVVNLYANYPVSKDVDLSLAVNNAFNTIGFTEAEGDGHAARSINGRTAWATLKYHF